MGLGRSAAENQRRFLLANEGIDRARVELGFDGDAVPFLCECPNPGCTAIVPLPPDEYRRIRGEANRFLLLPGHAPEGEDVVERADGYLVTRKEPA